MKKLLSIYIPTFNRYNYLKQSIERIFSNLEKYDIELIITDNNELENEDFIKYIKEIFKY